MPIWGRRTVCGRAARDFGEGVPVPNVFTTHLIDEASLQTRDAGIAFGVRLPWYRSLPMSVVDVAELKIDGQAVPKSKVRIEVNGHAFAADALGELVDEWWYVLDSARIHVDDAALARSAKHTVDLTLTLYPPYIPGLPWVTKASRAF